MFIFIEKLQVWIFRFHLYMAENGIFQIIQLFKST